MTLRPHTSSRAAGGRGSAGRLGVVRDRRRSAVVVAAAAGMASALATAIATARLPAATRAGDVGAAAVGAHGRVDDARRPRAQNPAPSAAASAPVRAFVEVEGLPAQAWVGQVCDVTVRVGVDAPWFAAQAVPLTAQALDQPFHVQIPWLRAGDDTRAVVVPPADGVAVQRVAVGDRAEAFAVGPVRTVDGRAFATLQLRARWRASREGTFDVPAVRLRYAFATEFVEDFLRGRQPRDRQETAVVGEAMRVRVSALPQPAPAGYTGAVGAFTLAVAPAAAAAEVGRALAVAATLTGDGNFGDFAFALAQPVPGFHVDGVVAVPGSDGRAFRLDVLPLRAAARELPPLSFVAFNPRTGGYVRVASPAVPLAVAAATASLPPRVQQLVDADAAAGPARRWPLPVGAALALLVAGLVRGRGRRRARAAVAAAIDAFASAPVDAAAPRLAAFEAALARIADLPAWRADGFEALAKRLPAELVAALRVHHGSLDAARFGGSVPPTASLLADLRRAKI